MKVFKNPVFEESNSILRKYLNEIDMFLRVTFVDENLDKGHYVFPWCKDLTNHVYSTI